VGFRLPPPSLSITMVSIPDKLATSEEYVGAPVKNLLNLGRGYSAAHSSTNYKIVGSVD
jgi:hypothetical protein